ncbi:MAG: DUF5691 domain-containing protein [Ktedonobacteraceae bacterium]
MDAFVTAALLGTAQVDTTHIETGTAVDTLTAKLSEAQEKERALLLTAGVWAIYKQAGKVAEQIPTIPEPAPSETLPPCSAVAATLLARCMNGEYSEEILNEALALLRDAGKRLPPELLPDALNKHSSETRRAVAAVIGERGRWLSQFNLQWSWVRATTADNALPSDAETLWEEGTLVQRRELLHTLRAIDPTQARAWLTTVWKQEKAEARASLLETFEVGLSSEDEAFLETALDDRSSNVRAIAVALLVRLPASALVQRMQARADAMLTYTDGKLAVKLPTTLDKAWERDGIAIKPPSGKGERAWWLTQVMAVVPPAHWEERFSCSPDDLVKAATSHKWSDAILEGWTRAAILHKHPRWATSIDDWLHQQKHDKGSWRELRGKLFACMSPKAAENRVKYIITHLTLSENVDWEDMLAALPRPWSEELGKVYLTTLQLHINLLLRHTKSSDYQPWMTSLTIAATALPRTCFDAVVEPGAWTLPETEMNRWEKDYWAQELQKFTETIQFRQRLMEEISR